MLLTPAWWVSSRWVVVHLPGATNKYVFCALSICSFRLAGQPTLDDKLLHCLSVYIWVAGRASQLAYNPFLPKLSHEANEIEYAAIPLGCLVIAIHINDVAQSIVFALPT